MLRAGVDLLGGGMQLLVDAMNPTRLLFMEYRTVIRDPRVLMKPQEQQALSLDEDFQPTSLVVEVYFLLHNL